MAHFLDFLKHLWEPELLPKEDLKVAEARYFRSLMLFPTPIAHSFKSELALSVLESDLLRFFVTLQ